MAANTSWYGEAEEDEEPSARVRRHFVPERLERLATALGVGPLVEKPLGCGRYGCAYQERDGKLAVKITTDDAEAPMWQLQQELRLAGLPYVQDVVRLDTNEGQMFAIVREAVDRRLPRELTRDMTALSGRLLRHLVAYAGAVSDPDNEDWLAPEVYARRVMELPIARDLGAALLALDRAGYPPTDLHMGNLSTRIHGEFGEVGQIVFIDPGHMSKSPPPVERTMAANAACFFCGDPAAHPATGVQRTENVLACRQCAEEFETWTRRREKGGRRGEPSFTEASLKHPPRKLEPNVRKKKWVEGLLQKRGAIEQAIGARLGRMLGCGHWGCVFESEDPWVVKLSVDPTEGPIWEKITQLVDEEQYGGDGFTRVRSIFRILPDLVTPAGRKKKVWAIVREGVEPVQAGGRFSPHTLATLGVPLTTEDKYWPALNSLLAFETDSVAVSDRIKMFTDAMTGLSKYRTAATAWHAFGKRGEWLLAGMRTREQAEDKIQNILSHYFSGPIAGPLGESLLMLASNGVYLRDVHWGNVGWRVPKADDEWACLVVYDPGHTPTAGGKDIPQALIQNGREPL
jgi:hypothetical protein